MARFVYVDGMNATVTRNETEFNRVEWHRPFVGVTLTPIILLGIVGNMFSLLVWIKGRRRKTSTATFLSALAVADILVLSTPAAEFWISSVLHLEFRHKSRVLCRIFYFLSYVEPSLSSWILVAVTMERALSVWVPHKINVICRPVTAVASTILISFLLLCLYLPVLVGVDVVTKYTSDVMWRECTSLSTSAYNKYLLEWLYLDLGLFFLVPFATIFACNGLILGKVGYLAKKRRTTLQGGQQQTRGGNGKSKKMFKTVTKRIVILSMAFCVCNAPLSVYNIIVLTPELIQKLSTSQRAVLQDLRVPFHVLMYLNNGINFLLYCFIGSGFRKDLVGIFRPSSRTSTTR